MKENHNMLAIPADERPYEKCWRYGPGALSDAELLAVILRCGSKSENALSLARRILYGSGFDGLAGLCHVALPELVSIPGVGRVKAAQVKCAAELAGRLVKSRSSRTVCFTNPSSIAAFYMEDLRHEEQENVILLMLDTKGALIAEKTISVGTVNSSAVSPREIFLTALANRAVSIVLLHNHPSGDPTPSAEDILLTERVCECGNMLGIRLLDHVVIGDGRAVSLREQKLF